MQIRTDLCGSCFMSQNFNILAQRFGSGGHLKSSYEKGNLISSRKSFKLLVSHDLQQYVFATVEFRGWKLAIFIVFKKKNGSVWSFQIQTVSNQYSV
jgi:hypothetical protein